MKKRMWFLVLPVVLLVGVFWMRDAAWKKTEADFHHEMREWTNEVYMPLIYVENSKRYANFGGQWKKEELLSAVGDMKLMRSPLKPLFSPFDKSNMPRIVVILSDGGDSGQLFGFYLALNEDRGWACLPVPPYKRWEQFELTPETCRVLKKRILSLKKNRDGELATSR